MKTLIIGMMALNVFVAVGAFASGDRELLRHTVVMAVLLYIAMCVSASQKEGEGR